MNNIKPFYINDSSVIVNLTTSICKNHVEVLESYGFKRLLNKFLASINQNSNRRLFVLKQNIKSEADLLNLFKLLLVYTFEETINIHDNLKHFEPLRKELLFFIDSLYDYWLAFERYGIIQKNLTDLGFDNSLLVESTTNFWNNNITLYRLLQSKLRGKSISVYRQTPGGFNAGFIVSKPLKNLPEEYSALNDISVINSVIIRTPFIGHSKSNSRSGLFLETDKLILNKLNLTKRHWLCYPIKIGDLLAYVYFHRDLLHHGIALSNLFEPAFDEYRLGKKPNIIYVYGSNETEHDKTFYVDKKNDVYFGYVSRTAENDYFGYMKKMLLTLHNVYMINHQSLPIHGAMVNIVFHNDLEKNIVIIGDSGAGKSETLEALRYIASTKIKEMNVVFDDMGIFYKKANKIYAKGTETGAFIRLDDLETGYAYRELDRAIFMNPEMKNARVLLPVSTYDFIVKEHAIDYVLYANNYDDFEYSIRFFENIESALKVFKAGKRRAKGTTSETGLVESYFANPFGCIQQKSLTDPLIDDFFKTLKENDIPIGEIYTKLAVDGLETIGVKEAAKKLLDLIR